jgi:hypothetical protein
LRGILKRLLQTHGRVTPLNTIAHLRSTPGVVNAAAPAVQIIEGTHMVLAAADALHNQCRLIVRGLSATGANATVTLYDETANKALTSLVINNAAATTFIGNWTNVVPWNIDHVITVRVLNDNVHAQTLYAVESHFRTVKAQ